mmetsp:Transcript_6019/g.20577  ORF Transcript_6019/g.20577 Transcript_6019/m.20577 type:complete len:427 (+) Transcript_6019:120-1400(+)
MHETFRSQILSIKDASGGNPVVLLGDTTYMYSRHSNVWILMVTNGNANAAAAFKFVNDLVFLFKSYFGGQFDEDAIKNNFVLIYELLDEVMDFGYPQNLAPEMLKLYITQEGVKSDKKKESMLPANATVQVTGAVGWRQEGLRYKKNEVYLDIIENVNLLMSAGGMQLRADVSGKIQMKCFLSGMPDLKLGLNDKLGMERDTASRSAQSGGGAGSSRGGGSKSIELDDVTFHQCVNLSRFDSNKEVSFVPPDGEFELMKYRITDGVSLPFRVLPMLRELGRTRMEANVRFKSLFSAKLFALGVVMRVPVPKWTAKARIQVSSGKAKYDAATNCLVWKMKRVPGQQEFGLSAEVDLVPTTSEKKAWSRPPISLEFQVPMFTASGLRVRFLKVWEKSNYDTVKWVRYICKSGAYEVRCGEDRERGQQA